MDFHGKKLLDNGGNKRYDADNRNAPNKCFDDAAKTQRYDAKSRRTNSYTVRRKRCFCKSNLQEVRIMLNPKRNAILLAMARRGLTVQELAELSEVPPRTLSDVMRGEPTRPKTLGKVAKALRVDPAELIWEDTRDEG